MPLRGSISFLEKKTKAAPVFRETANFFDAVLPSGAMEDPQHPAGPRDVGPYRPIPARSNRSASINASTGQ